jgi:hypothetical protein
VGGYTHRGPCEGGSLAFSSSSDIWHIKQNVSQSKLILADISQHATKTNTKEITNVFLVATTCTLHSTHCHPWPHHVVDKDQNKRNGNSRPATQHSSTSYSLKVGNSTTPPTNHKMEQPTTGQGRLQNISRPSCV